MVDSAAELNEAVAPEETFFINASFINDELTVTGAEVGSASGWTFEAEENTAEGQKWGFRVYPNRGGPKNDVVLVYRHTEDGGEVTNGQVYAHAFEFNG